jgi:tetratricopeptide (TPR) repeat protein
MSNEDGSRPESHTEWTKTSSALLEQGDYTKALEAAERAITLCPEHAAAWVMKGRALNALNRPEEGLDACDHAIGYDRNLFDAYYCKGLIREEQERWQEALAEYDQALRIDSASMDALNRQAGVLGSLSDLRGSEAAAPMLPISNRMIRLNPNDLRGWLRKAQALCVQEQYRAAEETINHALTLEPDNNGALALKGMIYEKTGRTREARDVLKKVAARVAAEHEPKHEMVQELKDHVSQLELSQVLSRYDPSELPTEAEAKKGLIICWIFTLGVGLLFSSLDPVAPIITIPLVCYAAWSLYWGWGPVWRGWRNALGGWGFRTSSGLVFIVIMCLFFELPAFIAIGYGAFTGIGRYRLYRKLAGDDRGGIIAGILLGVILLVRLISHGGSTPSSDSLAPPSPVRPDTASLAPKIVRVETFREGVYVFFRLFFTDPNSNAAGFGFKGAKGAGWAEANFPFSSPSYGRVAPGRIDYPFNHGCGTGSEYESDVEAWIYNSTGVRSPSITVHLACSAPSEVGTSATSKTPSTSPIRPTSTRADVVATVNGASISRVDFDARVESSKSSTQGAVAVLKQMIQGLLIDQYAKDNHIDIADADVQKKEDNIKSKYPPGQFESILKKQNISEDDVKRILRQSLVLDKAVAAGVNVSNADIASYLAKHHATLDTGQQVATLANSSDKIREILTQQQEQQQIPKFLADLRQKANIEIYDDKLKEH